jgi:hypothetical protein
LRAVLTLSAELSCPPWEFDVLWQARPEIRLGPDGFPIAAAQLLDAGSPSICRSPRVSGSGSRGECAELIQL